MNRLALFASGSGTNVENIIEYFKDSTLVDITLVLTNNPNAFVIERCKKLNIECVVFSKEQFQSGDVNTLLHDKAVDFIVLAGFLWLVPEILLKDYPDKIINIHPALLPKYGGKGMYGHRVHEAVIEAGEKQSGITIHYVNEHYDEGKIISQQMCDIETNDTPDSLAQKVHALEYEFFPKVIEEVVRGRQ